MKFPGLVRCGDSRSVPGSGLGRAGNTVASKTLWIYNQKFNTYSLSSLDPFPTSMVVPNVQFFGEMIALGKYFNPTILLFSVFVHHHTIETFSPLNCNNVLSMYMDQKEKKTTPLYLSF